MKPHILRAIGMASSHGATCRLSIYPDFLPAMKYLSMFSHATLVYGDGTGAPFSLCVTELIHVDEREGRVTISAQSGLAEGNVLYDIKPYMPCEDRILGSTAPLATSPVAAAGGREEVTVPPGGVIRREKGRYFLYPKDYDTSAARVRDCSHVKVIWWFSRFDEAKYRRATQGDPPYENAPRSGVFATRSPVRPNPIAVTVAQMLALDEAQGRIEVSELDCFDNTPLMTLEPYVGQRDEVDGALVPEWLAHWPDRKQIGAPASQGEVPAEIPGEAGLEKLLHVSPSGLDPADYFRREDVGTSEADQIVVRGARQNNLQNIDISIPKGRITAIAGVSGSGKSSLAFDTLYAESRLRLSQAEDGLEKPDVDSITGLPPAVAIAQRAIGRNPRATVGTFTGISDRLRLLYAAIGRRHCPKCARWIQPQSRDALVTLLRGLDGQAYEIRPHGQAETVPHTVDVARAVDEALRLGKGAFYLRIQGGEDVLLQTRQMCYHCEQILFELSPALFSFNNPESMCPVCSGLGVTTEIDPTLVVSRPHRSLFDGASDYWGDMRTFRKNPSANWMRGELLALAHAQSVDLERPWQDLPRAFRETALYGNAGQEVSWSYVHPKNGRSGTITRPVEGAVPILNRLLQKGGSAAERIAAQYVRPMPCPVCQGERLGQEGRRVTLQGLRFPEAARMTVQALGEWLYALPAQLGAHDAEVAGPLLRDMYRKAQQLTRMGLAYLELSRAIPTLSGGELQRLKLVAQMELGLSGLLYVMDEPTAGLHPRDVPQILHALEALRAEGNTVLVVEHDETLLRSVDHLVEIGPGAGVHGGRVVWQGTPEAAFRAGTQTGLFLSGRQRIAIRRRPLPPRREWISLSGARGNNLRQIDVAFPMGRITCITGVSGSGKSTLATQVIAPAVERILRHQSADRVCDEITGTKGIRGVIHASQAPIGRSSRSTLATYMGLLDGIRLLFAATPQARAAGLPVAAFSFNNKEGQCDHCKGEGAQIIAVPFAPDIRAVCPVCAGRRYRGEVLDIRLEGKSIHEVLELPVEEAQAFFREVEKLHDILGILCDVGLGYLRIGQSTTTLSGGEAQRVKLAKALTERRTGTLLYVLDEPTSGLHFSDMQNLLQLLARLAVEGHTVLVTEHNPHVAANADWIIDLGPEGGARGGQVVIQGTPEEVAGCARSDTGAALRRVRAGDTSHDPVKTPRTDSPQ